MKHWSGKHVLLTGGAGFLGSHMAHILLARGAKVTVINRDGRAPLKYDGFGGEAPLCRAVDVTDYQAVSRVLEEQSIEVVFHIAARSIVGEANRNPTAVFETNIKGTWTMLEACRHNQGVKKVVVSSSDKAYGDSKDLPYVESTPLRGSHPYDVSKSCADLIASAYFNTYGLPVCVSRCGNYFGPGDNHLDRIVPGTILAALKGQPPVVRSDGKSVRDYLYVKDGAEAHLLLAEKMDDPRLWGQAFNFSNQRPMTVLEIIEAILKETGRQDLRPQILNEASGEIKAQFLDASKARDILGWQPLYIFTEALAQTIKWYAEHYIECPQTASGPIQ